MKKKVKNYLQNPYNISKLRNNIKILKRMVEIMRFGSIKKKPGIYEGLLQNGVRYWYNSKKGIARFREQGEVVTDPQYIQKLYDQMIAEIIAKKLIE